MRHSSLPQAPKTIMTTSPSPSTNTHTIVNQPNSSMFTGSNLSSSTDEGQTSVIQSYQGEIGALKSENESLRDENSCLQDENATLNLQVSQSAQYIDELQQRNTT